MRTLDEVIKSYELSCGDKNCSECPYDDECLDHFVCECYERMDDTLHYLKEYRQSCADLVENNKRYIQIYIEYREMIDELNRNDPLTWDELKQMIGKPVWIEWTNYPSWNAWFILGKIFGDGTVFLNGDRNGRPTKEYYGKTWQAYRKERHEADN